MNIVFGLDGKGTTETQISSETPDTTSAVNATPPTDVVPVSPLYYRFQRASVPS